MPTPQNPQDPQPNTPPGESDHPSIRPDQLTWAVLLARWTDFARSAVALPKDGEGGRVRESVAPMIGLQAIVFALGEVHRLPASERSLGLDRAEVLIARHVRELHDAWRGHAMPRELQILISDARGALAAARAFGTEWIVLDERLVAPDPIPLAQRLIDAGFDGVVLAAAPGTVLFRGAPLLFATPHLDQEPSGPFAGCAARDAAGPRQVYRQADDAGRPLRDLLLPMDETLPAGRPLLLPVIEEGRLVAEFDPAQADAWRAEQERWLDGRTLPVVEGQAADTDR